MAEKLSKEAAVAKSNGFIAEIDAAELAVRLIERGCHMKRPAGLSGREAWAQFERAGTAGEMPRYIVEDFEAMAHIAIEYFGECIQTLQQKS